MTSFNDGSPAVAPAILDEATQALQIAISELGRHAENPTMQHMLKVIIDGAIECGVRDPTALAHAAVDEVVLVTAGKVRPSLTTIEK